MRPEPHGGIGGFANRVEARGILSLFERIWNDRPQLQATSSLVTLAEWVAATQAGGGVVLIWQRKAQEVQTAGGRNMARH